METKKVTAAKISTPCTRQCRLVGGVRCYGCGRTWQQIKNWSFYSEEERIKIIKDLKKPVFDDI